MEIIKSNSEMKQEAEIVAEKTTKSAPNDCTIPEDLKFKRTCTLTPDMIKMLVLQMGHELENYTMYKTFAAYYYRNDLSKLGEYYDLRAAEEDEHHKWIYNYLTDCDAEFSYPAIPAINIKIENLVHPFLLTVDREILTTYNINQLAKQAVKEGDWATINFLNGDDPRLGKLVKEQMEEEATSRTVYGMAKMENVDWLKKQDSILSFYTNN